MSKVAIITRTKNRPLLLKRSLRSVALQKYRDFIHVIVNDGGDREEVESILKEHGTSSIKLVHNERSVGYAKALNNGIKAVDSKYVTVLDDDDSWSPDYLSLMVAHLEQTRSKGVVAVLDRVEEKIENGKIKHLSTTRWRPDIHEVTLYGQCIDNYAIPAAFVYERSVYDELGGYDESLDVAEDWEFNLRFLMKYDIDFLRTEDALAFYHHRPKAEGSVGNSVFAGVDRHQYQMNMLANKFLRKDLAAGQLGLGYIINSLRYERQSQQELNSRLESILQCLDSEIKSVHRNNVQELQLIESRLADLIIERTSIKGRVKKLMPRLRNNKKVIDSMHKPKG